MVATVGANPSSTSIPRQEIPIPKSGNPIPNQEKSDTSIPSQEKTGNPIPNQENTNNSIPKEDQGSPTPDQEVPTQGLLDQIYSIYSDTISPYFNQGSEYVSATYASAQNWFNDKINDKEPNAVRQVYHLYTSYEPYVMYGFAAAGGGLLGDGLTRLRQKGWTHIPAWVEICAAAGTFYALDANPKDYAGRAMQVYAFSLLVVGIFKQSSKPQITPDKVSSRVTKLLQHNHPPQFWGTKK